MKGYKGFKKEGKQLYCSPNKNRKEYKVGEIATQDGELNMCYNGIHFCQNIADVNAYYSLLENVICEVEAVGEVVTKEGKSVTDKLKVIKELTKAEVLELAHNGKNNTGLCNSGYRNSGDWNSGYCNSGDRNSGDWNSGYCNSGDCNSGDWNSGDRNSGDCNSGDWNSGDWNSGYWNKTNNSSGVFCTVEPKVLIFDIPTDMTLSEWRNKRASQLLQRLILNKWVYEEDMTDTEKENYKDYEVLGGYLKTYNYKDACQIMWDNFNQEEKEVIQAIPNFDRDKFKEITGIEV